MPGGQRRAASPWGLNGSWKSRRRFDGSCQGRRHGSLCSLSGRRLPSGPTRTELALLLAARPEPLRERMESADGNDTHEPGRDRDVRSASAANGLTFMTAPATSANPTTHVQVSSGLPGASDASLCVEVASPSAMTPTIIASAHARAADAGTRQDFWALWHMERELWPGLVRWLGASDTTNRGVSSDHRNPRLLNFCSTTAD